MIRKLLAGLLIALLAVAAIEYQGTGYLASAARALVAPSKGPRPQDIIETGTAAGGTTTLLAVGDIADCDERTGFAEKLPNLAYLLGLPSAYEPNGALAHETAAVAESMSDVPILALGDTVYNSGTPVEFADCFEPTWGDLKPRILPAPGNHEYKTPAAFGYYDYFGAQAGPERRGWYAARVPGWVILSLNSEVDAAPGSAQATWLRDQLDDVGNACILAFFHKPAYSLVERGGRENAVDLFRQLQQSGATLVLNGHNHFYERTAPLDGAGRPSPDMGTVAFTVGTGGRVKGEKPITATTEAAAFGQTGLLRLELRDSAYTWSYIDAVTRNVIDEGTRPCNPARG